MIQDDPKQPDHLHADQDEVGGTDRPPYAEQQEGAEERGGESNPTGVSKEEPFGHDEEGGDEAGVDVEGED
jgi:hypothetical protein